MKSRPGNRGSTWSPYGAEIMRLKRERAKWARSLFDGRYSIRDLTFRINHIARRASTGAA